MTFLKPSVPAEGFFISVELLIFGSLKPDHEKIKLSFPFPVPFYFL